MPNDVIPHNTYDSYRNAVCGGMLHLTAAVCQIIKSFERISNIHNCYELGVGEGVGAVRTKMIGSCAVMPLPS